MKNFKEEDLPPGTKIKMKDEPSCECTTCQHMKGKILTVEKAVNEIIHFKDETNSLENATIRIDDIEKIVPTIPEELFQI